MEPDPILTQHRLVAAQAENEALRADNAALREDNAALRLEMTKLREAMEKLQHVLEAIQGKLDQDSHNSHKPPSSDGPKTPPRPPAAPSGRKRGGQPGRQGKARAPLPEGSEKRTVEVPLTACPHCAATIPPEAITGIVTQRVLDLVHELTEVTAFRLEVGLCPCCHKAIQAPLPPEGGAGELGPQLRALAAYLRTQGRMSLGPLHFFFKEILKADVSRGWLYESGVRVGDALAPIWEALAEEIRQAKVVNMDETGFGRKDRDWIWVALSAPDRVLPLQHHPGLCRPEGHPPGGLPRRPVHRPLHGLPEAEGCRPAVLLGSSSPGDRLSRRGQAPRKSPGSERSSCRTRNCCSCGGTSSGVGRSPAPISGPTPP